jgi:hypothetical protein
MEFLNNIPAGVWYALIGLGAFIACGFMVLSAITLIKGGKIKAGKEGIELDTEDEKKI